MEYIEKLTQMRADAINVLIASFYRETQVGRSISSSDKDCEKSLNKAEFNSQLKDAILRLISLVDKGSITNFDIRYEIKKLSENSGACIGQAQKVINVYLKFYCLLLNKPIDIIRELDCPLDSTTMNKQEKMKNIDTMEKYQSWQKTFEKQFGLRIFRDSEYDTNRIDIFLKKQAVKSHYPLKTKNKRVTKKSVCIEHLLRKEGASLIEMAQAIVDRGIDPDFEKNLRVCRLWMSKIGFPVKKLQNSNYIKA